MNIKEEINNLNSKQKSAVLEKKSKRLLILAGAGSGKTKVLTVRIAYLLHMGVNPDSIFAVTFTNKAANEMMDRIKNLSSNSDLSNFWCGTFHSLSLRIIKDNLSNIDIRKSFSIMDADDQKSLVKRSLLNLAEKNKELHDTIPKDDIKDLIKSIQGFINQAKENEKRPSNASSILSLMGLPSYFLDVYKEYEEQRVFSNAMDFADLILYAVEILRDSESVRDYYQNKFRHIFVDEFQDTNPIQYKLINLLSNKKAYHTMVGDDDQLIYSWRGANIGNIKDYYNQNKGDLKVVKLEQNYRSYSTILGAANSLIKNNKNRMGKELWSALGEGEKITVMESLHQDDEAVNVVSSIKKALKIVNPSDIAILYRNNFLSRAFEGQLTKNKIPYKIVGGLSFWQRKEVKDIMAYLLLVNDTNNDLAYERAISAPKRGVGEATMKKIRKYAIDEKVSLFQSHQEMINKGIIKNSKTSEKSNSFFELINDMVESDYSINHMINRIMIETDIEEEYKKEGMDVYTVRKENIDELASYSTFYSGKAVDRLPDFIQNTTLQSDSERDNSIESVSLMTIHSAKGLEFKYVFIVGFEDSIFPSKQSLALLEKDINAIEEERRLAYVAITRAKKKLSISFSNSRYYSSTIYSRFLDEIPVEYLDYKGKSIYGVSKIGRKIREYKSKNNSSNFNVGDIYKDDLMGDGEILEIVENGDKYELLIDYGFLGKVKKIINK